ncbi:uncharacterized protein LOC122498231 isoform X2 [Leptopilina heterotoma]|uniref:uncharacterized protein LOC122498231 isoform X2 n=1 Tax=Leptopilina heterotoma TaxID=63436 RepID=UPI001CA9FA61|nr:uncharacterized protein LOC122498231 isoform X2 [Leptopilina heterotoma]
MGISESIDTREYIAGNYERPIEVLNFTDTTCTILWKKPTNAIKDMVNSIQVIDKGDRNIKTRYIFASSGKPFTIYDLYPGNDYAFSVSTMEAQLSPFAETECRTTPVKVKMKEPTPLFYRVLKTTDDSCTIQWMKTRNMSDIHYETIWFSKNSVNDGYKINFIVIGTDNQPFNIHTAKDACIAHHQIVTPAKPKESDFDITLHSVDTLFPKRQNITTIKLHNSTNINCELLWYAIQMCISLNTCFDKEILRCNKDLNIASTFKPDVYYFKIATCNKIGCSQSINTKLL